MLRRHRNRTTLTLLLAWVAAWVWAVVPMHAPEFCPTPTPELMAEAGMGMVRGDGTLCGRRADAASSPATAETGSKKPGRHPPLTPEKPCPVCTGTDASAEQLPGGSPLLLVMLPALDERPAESTILRLAVPSSDRRSRAPPLATFIGTL